MSESQMEMSQENQLRLLDVTKFSGHVYRREYNLALRKLIDIIYVAVGKVSFSGSFYEEERDRREAMNKNSEYSDRLLSILTSGVTALISDPKFEIDETNFRNFISLRGALRRIFLASSYQNMQHFHGILGDLSGNLSSIRPKNLTKSFIILTLNTLDKNYLARIEQMQEDVQALVWLSFLDVNNLFLDSEQRNLDSLIEIGKKIRPTAFTMPIEISVAARVWFHCTYWNNPKKHQVKKFINQCLNKTAIAQRYYPSQLKNLDKVSRDKKVLLVVLELWHSKHAMYRCYSKGLEALSNEFRLVALGTEQQTLDENVTMFDEVIRFDANLEFSDVRKAIMKITDLAPDAIFYPSVGMSPVAVQLAQLRLAPVQMMSGGHPASSFSTEMDYFLMEEDFMPSIETVSEKLVKVKSRTFFSWKRLISKEALDEMNKESEKQRSSKIQVVVNSSLQKITPEFIDTCKEIERKSSRNITFSFLIGADLFNRRRLEDILKQKLESPIVYSDLPYDDYLRVIANSDLQLTPFPFGNTNGFCDAMVVGVPTLCLIGESPESLIDSAMSKKMGLPPICRAESREIYIDSAVRLIDEPQERRNIESFIKSVDLDDILFFELGDDFSKLVSHLIEKHHLFKSSSDRIISFEPH